MNERGLRLAVAALGGREENGVLVVWKKGCVDPRKYILLYKENGARDDLELVRRSVKLRTPRDFYAVVKQGSVIIDEGEVPFEGVRDEFLRELLKLAEKLSG